MLTDKLTELARDYHQLQGVRHVRGAEADGNAAHRKMGQKMAEIAGRFERLVEHWIDGDPRAESWRRHLYDGAEAPDGPDLTEPPLFRGRNDAGARIEVRRAPAASGAAYEVFSDGARIARESAPWDLAPEIIEPVTIAGQPCLDTFDTSPAAQGALGDWVATSSGEPPWHVARELYDDGLIDFDFALTARGRRCLAKRAGERTASRADLAGARVHYVVLAADGARARIFLLAADRGRAPTLMPLTEVADMARPDGRARARDLHSESRPPQRADLFAGPGSGHAVSDHREDRRRESSRDFADSVVEAASRVWRTLPSCEIVVVASPTMLGLLRPALGRRTGGPAAPPVRELARDLSKLAPAALHDTLAGAGLLPARGRREPRPAWQRNGA